MKATVTQRQMAQYIGSRYKRAMRLARVHRKAYKSLTNKVTPSSSTERYHLNRWLNHATHAAMWQRVAKDFQAGFTTTQYQRRIT